MKEDFSNILRIFPSLSVIAKAISPLRFLRVHPIAMVEKLDRFLSGTDWTGEKGGKPTA
jgi:hypothetical protein